MEHWFGRIRELHELSGPRREFLEKLAALLDRLQPPAVDRTASKITPHRRGAHATIAHALAPDDSLLLDISDDEVTVSFGSEH